MMNVRKPLLSTSALKHRGVTIIFNQVEAKEIDETVNNRIKDARIERAKNKLKDARKSKNKNELKEEKTTMDAYYGLISAELQKLLEVWTIVGPERIIEPWDAIVDGNRSAIEGLKSRPNGVATSASLVGRRVS